MAWKPFQSFLELFEQSLGRIIRFIHILSRIIKCIERYLHHIKYTLHCSKYFTFHYCTIVRPSDENYDLLLIIQPIKPQPSTLQLDYRAKFWLVKRWAESWKDCSTERNQMYLALDNLTLRGNVIREVFKRPHRIVALVRNNQYIFLSTSTLHCKKQFTNQ